MGTVEKVIPGASIILNENGQKVKRNVLKVDDAEAKAIWKKECNGKTYVKKQIKDNNGKNKVVFVCYEDEEEFTDAEKLKYNLSTDGEDDGKISSEEIKEAAIEGITEDFKDMFSTKEKAIKNGAIIAAATAACWLVPGLGWGLALYAGISGAITAYNGYKELKASNSDGDTRKACKNISKGVFNVALSWLGGRFTKKAAITKANAVEKTVSIAKMDASVVKAAAESKNALEISADVANSVNKFKAASGVARSGDTVTTPGVLSRIGRKLDPTTSSRTIKAAAEYKTPGVVKKHLSGLLDKKATLKQHTDASGNIIKDFSENYQLSLNDAKEAIKNKNITEASKIITGLKNFISVMKPSEKEALVNEIAQVEALAASIKSIPVMGSSVKGTLVATTQMDAIGNRHYDAVTGKTDESIIYKYADE